MAQRDHRPHPILEGYVARCVGYDYLLDPRAVHHGLPAPTATVVIAFDDPLDTEWLGEPASRSRRWTTVSGLGLRPALIPYPRHPTRDPARPDPRGRRRAARHADRGDRRHPAHVR